MHFNVTGDTDGFWYQYKWLKVIDKDGKPTEHWPAFVEFVNSPFPYLAWGYNWLPCWPCGISGPQARQNMAYPNKINSVIFPPRAPLSVTPRSMTRGGAEEMH